VRKLGVIVTVTLMLCACGTSEATAMTPGLPRLSPTAVAGADGQLGLVAPDRGQATASAFTPGDITLASSGGEAFVLGTSPCGKRLCRELWSGTGRSFSERVAPPGSAPKYPGDTGTTDELVFANGLDGYALDSMWTDRPTAYATTNGALSWHKVSFGPGVGFESLVASAGLFFGVLFRCTAVPRGSVGCGDYRLARSVAGSTTWKSIPIPGTTHLSNVTIGLAAVGAYVNLLVPTQTGQQMLLRSLGGMAPFQVVAHEPAFFVAVRGACDLTATSWSSLWAVCPTGMKVAWFHSSDGGRHFRQFWYPFGTAGVTLDPVSGNLAFRYTGVELPSPGQLQRTTNGGTTFVSISHLPFNTGTTPQVAFLNADSGYILRSPTTALGDGELLQTSDGGRRWSKVLFERATLAHIPSSFRLDTSPKAIDKLLGEAQQTTQGTFSAVYKETYPLVGGKTYSGTFFFAQRSVHDQFASFISRSSVSAAEATSEFFSTGHGEYLCDRSRASARWQCSGPGSGNTATMLSSDFDEPVFLYEDLSFVASQYPAIDIAPRIADGQEVPCLGFGSTAKACFLASGFIGYFSTSVAIDNGWTGTATLLSYQPRVPTGTFVLPAVPRPEQ